MNNKIVSIQALRYIAAALVVVHHVLLTINNYYGDIGSLYDYGNIRKFGEFGVDIFFIISGFIIFYTNWDNFDGVGSKKIFLYNRLIRIVPIYWIFTIISVAIFFLFPSITSANVNLVNFLGSIFFIPVDSHPILKVGWSLNYEMYFYFIFALLLSFGRVTAIFLLGAIFAIQILIFYDYDGSSYIIKMISDPLLVEFYAGCILGFLYKKNFIPKKMSFLIIVFALIFCTINLIFEFNKNYRILYYGGTALLLVCWFLCSNFGSCNFVLSLGNLSYSLYISHPFVLPAVGLVVKKYHLYEYININFYPIIVLITCTIVAFFVYYFIEMPIVDKFKFKRSALHDK